MAAPGVRGMAVAGAVMRGAGWSRAVLPALLALALLAVAGVREGLADAGSAALAGRAAARGGLPVIIGLAVTASPEGTLAAADRAAQRAAIAAAQAGLLARLAAAEEVKRFETVPYLAAVLGPADLATALAAPEVASIVEDVAEPVALNVSVPLIRVPPVWRRGHRGSGWAVAVLDTGVQRDHAAFAGRIVAEACYSTRVRGTSISLCPGGASSSTAPGAGADCALRIGGCGHGTHVAGIAVGNRTGRRGVAPAAGLIAIKVFSRFDKPADCDGSAPCARTYVSDQMRGLERVIALAAGRRIAAVNLSLGGGTHTAACDSDPRKALVDTLRSLRIATVIAAGNDGLNGAVNAPGCISAAVTVGSTTKADAVSDFSNHARMVELLAPGSDISAPVLSRRTTAVGVKSGTSMATPHVAGAWALLMQGRPEATVDEVLQALACTGEPVTRNSLPIPRIDVEAARRFLISPVSERNWGFATDRQVAQWVKHLGSWSRAGGVMRTAGGNWSSFWNVATAPFCATDLMLTARVRRIDPDPVFDWNSGVMLFATIDAGKQASALWFAYNKHHFDEGEAPVPGGYAAIWALDNTDLLDTSSDDGRLLCANWRATSIRRDGYNVLHVVSEGGLHVFSINGAEVCRAYDPTFAAGDIAVAMGSTVGGGDVFDVDRLAAAGTEARAGAPDALPRGAAARPVARRPGEGPFGIDRVAQAAAVGTGGGE